MAKSRTVWSSSVVAGVLISVIGGCGVGPDDLRAVESAESAISVPAAPGGVTVDGVPGSKWNGVVDHAVSRLVVGSTKNPHATAQFGLLWSATHLYGMFVVSDTTAHADSSDPWRDDCVELFLDVDGKLTSTYDATDFHFLIRRTGEVTEVAHGATQGVVVAAREVAGGYDVEIAIPWSTLGATAASNKSFAVDVAIDDDVNGGERETQAIWHSADSLAYAHPDRFGWARLSGSGFLARRADNFVDTVGVVAHFGYATTRYFTMFEQIHALLREIGIRHIRESISQNTTVVARLEELGAEGFDFCMNVFNNGDTVPIPQHVATLLGVIRQHGLGDTLYIESHNEPDGSWPDHANWASGTQQWMREIRNQVNADPLLRNLTVMGSALAHADDGSRRAALGDQSSVVDIGNVHAYPGGRPHEARIPTYLRDVAENYPGRPIAVTETGYHTALQNPVNKHIPASERAKAIYLPRTLLEDFRLGVERTYIYQFFDQLPPDQTNQEAHFGLVSYDLARKPSYYAVKNLITIMQDRGGNSFSPGRLDYSIAHAPEDLREVLLQKQNGTFYLAVWRAATVWDIVARKDLDPGIESVTVAFGQPERISSFRPTQSAVAERAFGVTSSVTVPLEGDVVILEISPP